MGKHKGEVYKSRRLALSQPRVGESATTASLRPARRASRALVEEPKETISVTQPKRSRRALQELNKPVETSANTPTISLSKNTERGRRKNTGVRATQHPATQHKETISRQAVSRGSRAKRVEENSALVTELVEKTRVAKRAEKTEKIAPQPPTPNDTAGKIFASAKNVGRRARQDVGGKTPQQTSPRYAQDDNSQKATLRAVKDTPSHQTDAPLTTRNIRNNNEIVKNAVQREAEKTPVRAIEVVDSQVASRVASSTDTKPVSRVASETDIKPVSNATSETDTQAVSRATSNTDIKPVSRAISNTDIKAVSNVASETNTKPVSRATSEMDIKPVSRAASTPDIKAVARPASSVASPDSPLRVAMSSEPITQKICIGKRVVKDVVEHKDEKKLLDVQIHTVRENASVVQKHRFLFTPHNIGVAATVVGLGLAVPVLTTMTGNAAENLTPSLVPTETSTTGLPKQLTANNSVEAVAKAHDAQQNPVPQSQQTSGASGNRGAFAIPTEDVIVWPLQQGVYRYTSPFGYRIHPIFGKRAIHTGQDMAAPMGTPIHAVADGEVQHAGAGTEGYSNNLIIIKHTVRGETFYTYYIHMYDDGVFVKPGDKVKAGDVIGAVGSNGNSTGPHLHFEVHNAQNEPVEPLGFLTSHNALQLNELGIHN
ncbi:M23 family metallopeptidase [Actinotignum urinale]|uniref:M23 family metallopeptidase n=1 Tax=Actinotignum urinale TaxID=190146 RepID=UPI0003B622B4|nr:M23 family metallopeptidase [Actinotignum urinale]MDY5161057.1 peptidoglycan DD-metalloendopeptidase family protein [Actinotignum urinale]